MNLEQLQHIVENRINQSVAIKLEYPDIDYAPFVLNDLDYELLKHFSKLNKLETRLFGKQMECSLYTGNCYLKFRTKNLIVSEPIIIEE